MDNPQKADCLSLRVRFTGGDGTISGYALGEGLGSFLSDIEPLEVYYYDNYDFIEALNLDYLQYQDMPGYDARYICASAPGYSAKGLCTGKLTRVLGSDTMLASAVYYDCRGNVVQSHEQNALGGYEHCYYRANYAKNCVLQVLKINCKFVS